MLQGYHEEITLIHSKLGMGETHTTKMLADAHFNIGMLHKKRGDDDDAIENLESALDLTAQCNVEKTMRVAKISDLLGMLYASRKEFAVAKRHYSSAYSLYEQAIGRDDSTTSDCAFRLGKVLDALESDLALDFFKESLRVKRLNIAEDDERVAELLFCIGRFFLEREVHQDAVRAFEEVRHSKCSSVFTFSSRADQCNLCRLWKSGSDCLETRRMSRIPISPSPNRTSKFLRTKRPSYFIESPSASTRRLVTMTLCTRFHWIWWVEKPVDSRNVGRLCTSSAYP